MSTAPTPSGISNGATAVRDLFALTDEQILQIEPDARDVEAFGGERSDSMDPLRADLDLLASNLPAADVPENGGRQQSHHQGIDDGLKAGATSANGGAHNTSATNTSTDAASMACGDAPAWLAERMNDARHGAEARALWDGVLAARQEASAFREVFASAQDARAAAERSRTLDAFDRAYFGAADQAPEQRSASRAELATQMLREDPAAFREMVFAGLRALEIAGKQGSGTGAKSTADSMAELVAPPVRAASSANATAQPSPTGSQSGPQSTSRTPENQPSKEIRHAVATNGQETRVAAYAAFERATNADLERGIGGAIDRSLQAALPNASRSENGAALKQRLSAAIRQDVEKALQGDRALGEQVARILSGQRLDDAARGQVVRLIGDRAQQLLPGSARKVLADWTQTTLASHSNRVEHSGPRLMSSTAHATASAPKKPMPATERAAPPQRTSPQTSRKIDYRRVSDDDILDS
jgi:hypothetical protein